MAANADETDEAADKRLPGWIGWDESNRQTARSTCGAPIFGTTSGHLRSGNFVDCPCKRHHQSTLVFFPPCFASRGRGFESPTSTNPFDCKGFRKLVPHPILAAVYEVCKIALSVATVHNHSETKIAENTERLCHIRNCWKWKTDA